jgi:hypothetical protein
MTLVLKLSSVAVEGNDVRKRDVCEGKEHVRGCKKAFNGR